MVSVLAIKIIRDRGAVKNSPANYPILPLAQITVWRQDLPNIEAFYRRPLIVGYRPISSVNIKPQGR
jgi:hypothetical protein